jgi:hypothetical protein
MNWKDRQKIREEEMLNPNTIPVLLLYWNQEDLETYLIPLTPERAEELKRVNGRLCNEDGWEENSGTFDYIERMRYDPETGKEGPWKQRYLVDKTDEQAKPLLPLVVPPGTVVIQTGFIL